MYALQEKELWAMERSEDGFATVVHADRLKGIPEFISVDAAAG